MKQGDSEKEPAWSAKAFCEQWAWKKTKNTYLHSVLPAFLVSSFPSCPLSLPHDVTGGSRGPSKVIHPMAITNTCFDRLACSRKSSHACTDADWHMQTQTRALAPTIHTLTRACFAPKRWFEEERTKLSKMHKGKKSCLRLVSGSSGATPTVM